LAAADAKKGKKDAAPAAADAKGEKPAAVAEGTTGTDGTFSIANVPAGEYAVVARAKGEGNGRQMVTLKAGETSALTITLKPAKGGKKKDK
jgi:hypothetical protein